MPNDFPWLYALVVAAVVAWTVPKILKLIARATRWLLTGFAEYVSEAIIAQLGSRLAPFWGADFEVRMKKALAPIMAELTVNAGDSVKDRVIQVQRDMEPLLVEHRNRWDPPEGKPT